jgi:DNA-binding transcriptional regulator YiaG
MRAEQFHALRLRLDVTQVELARMLGVNNISVCRWETGVRPISRPIAILLRLLVKLNADDRPIPAARRRVVHSQATA